MYRNLKKIFAWQKHLEENEKTNDSKGENIHTHACLYVPFQLVCLLFSYLIALARPSSTVLNKSGESGRPALFPVLGAKH